MLQDPDFLRLRLRALIDSPRFAGNVTAAGVALGYKDGAFVRQMLAGSRPVTCKTLQKWIEEQRVPAAWFAFQDGDDQSAPHHAPLSNRRTLCALCVVGTTPGELPERIWDHDGKPVVGLADEYVEAATTDPQAFACKVVGDSMVPRYMPGEYALVEPTTPVEVEDDVLIRLATGETMLRRLLGRRGGIRLGSYTPQSTLSFQERDVDWMYYVAHPIPARRAYARVAAHKSP